MADEKLDRDQVIWALVPSPLTEQKMSGQNAVRRMSEARAMSSLVRRVTGRLLWRGLTGMFLSSTLLFCQEIIPLTPGTTIERELKGGESNSFQVSLAAGHFLQIAVEQKGIDVEVILFGPDGKRISHMDSINGMWGPEPIVEIADAGGNYRVQVDSPDKTAAAGHYEISVIEEREATAADRSHVSAERTMEQGQDLFAQGTADSLRAAVEKFDQALSYYQSSPDRYRHGLVFFSLGSAYAQLNEFRKAVDSYQQALPLFQSLSEQRMEASTLNNIGGAYDVLGDLQKALDLYDRALARARSAGDSSTEASILNNIGKIYGDMSDWQKAIEYYNQALPIFHALGDQNNEANTLLNIGTNYSDLGEPEQASDYMERSLKLCAATGDKVGQADTLERMGPVYDALGQADKATAAYEQALALRRVANNGWRTGMTLRRLAMAYSSQGDQEKALSCLEQSLELLKTAEDRRGEGITLDGIGQVYGLLGQQQKAIDYHNQALVLLEAVEDLNDEVRAREGLARAQRDLGNLSAARDNAEEALKLVEDVRSRAGGEQARASYFATQQSAYELYIDLLMRLHRQDPGAGYDARALEASERARARSLLEMLSESHVDFREGIDPDLLKREHDLVSSIDAKANRLLGLEGTATKDQAAELQKQIDELETQYQQLEVEIRQKSPRYAALTQPQPLSLRDIQQTLNSDTGLLEYALGSEHSYLWMVTESGMKSYELPKRADIESSVRKLYEQVTARSTYPRGELPDQRRARIAKADSELPKVAQELSTLVLGPVIPDLKSKRLVIVADGALQHVPFSMLPIPSENGQSLPLVAAHEVVGLPSASTIAVLRQELKNRKPAPRMLAVLADPVFDANDPRVKVKSAASATRRPAVLPTADSARILEHLSENGPVVTAARMVIPRLPYTRQEAEHILQVAPKGENFEALDFRASLATATSPNLANYRYLHFATHGYLDSEHPQLSAIVLSLVDPRGNSVAGFLRASDIYNLKLPADLIVLSACQTGLGKEIKGEGIVGLTRGFMYAGAARVDVSLWSVNDKATEQLMAIFYEKLLKEGMSPSASLREAQVEMSKSKQWANPYYWAAFVQQGEWK